MTYLLNIWDIAAQAAPWLLFGLLAAAIVKALVPTRWISDQLGRPGAGSVLKGSLVGIPLPLCSCGVLPTALSLRRQGAGKPATVSFLVSTPEIGLDSFLLSFALLGPVMAVARPIAAFGSAVFAGLMTLFVDRPEAKPQPSDTGSAAKSCCSSHTEPEPANKSCCSSSDDAMSAPPSPGVIARMIDGLRYVFTTLWDDVKLWLGVAVVVAGLAMAYTGGQPAAFLQQWGSGPPAMLIMLLVGIPLYICATASTPIAAALLVAGVSPGTVLVLLLAGPATNLGSIAVLRKELGTPVLLMYLLSIAVTAMGAGLILDAVVGHWQFDIAAQATHSAHLLPHWFGTVSAIALIVLAITPLRNLLFGIGGKRQQAAGHDPHAHHHAEHETPADHASAPASSCCCGGEKKSAPASQANHGCCH